MIHWIFKNILRAKYMVSTNLSNRRYFWKQSTACNYANKLGGKQIVWTTGYKMYATFNGWPDFRVHPDAHNYNPYQP